MHCANLRAFDCCLGVRCPLNVPGGCSPLHASTAFCHTAGLTVIPPTNSPDAVGSANPLSPWARIQSANFTAFSYLEAAVSPPLLPLLPVAGALEPHPLIRATVAIGATGARGRRRLRIVSPAGRDRVDIKAVPTGERTAAGGNGC